MSAETLSAKKSVWDELKDQWSLFLKLVGDPLILTLAALAVGIGAVAVLQADKIPTGPNDKVATAVLTGLASLVAAIAGTVWSRRWSALTEERIIVARGIGAIRALKLQFAHLSDLERQIRLYTERLPSAMDNQPLIETWLENVLMNIESTKKAALNSIEDWADVAPGVANIQTTVEQLTGLRNEKLALAKQNDDLLARSSELAASKEEAEQESQKRIDGLLSQNAKEREAKDKKIAELQRKLDSSGVGGIAGFPGLAGIRDMDIQTGYLKAASDAFGSLAPSGYTVPSLVNPLGAGVLPDDHRRKSTGGVSRIEADSTAATSQLVTSREPLKS